MNSKNYLMVILTSQMLAANYLNVIGGVSQTQFNLTPPFQSGISSSAQSFNLGVNIEQFVQPNISFSFETIGSYTKNSMYSKRHPQFSACLTSSYYVAPGASLGLGLNVTHTPMKDKLIFNNHPNISHFTAANAIISIRSSITNESFIRLELLSNSFLPAHQNGVLTNNDWDVDQFIDFSAFSQPGIRLSFGYLLQDNIFDAI